MELSILFMYLGFILAAYSVVGNDSLQTLGTFLASNAKMSWVVLWLFAGSILTITLLYGWYHYDGDVSYGRLEKYPHPEYFHWYYLLPPLVLLFITRSGIPVSTSFMVLTFFNEENLYNMTVKSMSGYLVAFAAAIVVYISITKLLEKKFIQNPIKEKELKYWRVFQWMATAFLWGQWLIQDFANIYVYLPRDLDIPNLIFSLVVLLGMLAYIFWSRGGKIQKIVLSKTNTVDIRSATIIDLLYGVVLYYFKELNNIPMSTTWVFIGLLAGREIAIQYMLHKKGVRKEVLKNVGLDLGKVFLGLIISIALVFFIKFAGG